MAEAGARGAAVVLQGEHMCMRMRGIAKHGADMVTTALRGVLATDPALRTTAIDLLRSR
jgi:GTP cyclohydrolase I